MAISIDAIFQGIFGINIIGIEKQHDARISGIFGDELILGSYLSRLFPLSFCALPLFLNKYVLNLKVKYLLSVFFILLIGSAIFFSGERTAFAIFFIVLFLLFLFVPANRLIVFYSCLLLIFSFLLISFLQPNIQDRMIKLTIKNFEIGYERYNRIIAFTEQHEAHYQVGLKMFNEKKLLGYGPKMFRKLCKNYDEFGCSTHPHNSYIQLLAETGLIGFMIFFSLFCILIFSIARYYLFSRKIFDNQNQSNKIIILIAIFISFFPLIPSGNFFGNWNNTVYYLPLGILIYLNFENNKTISNR